MPNFALQLDLAPVVLAMLITIRVMAFLFALPMFGLRGVPVVIRLALSVWIAWALLPMVAADAPLPRFSPAPLALAISVEMFIGMLLAFSVSMLFAIAQMAGQVVGVQMAFSLVNVIDPMSDSQVSATSQIYYFFAGLLFLALDGPEQIVRGIAASVQLLPPGGWALDPGAIFLLVTQVGSLFAIGLRLAAPPVVALMLVSVTMGIIGRTVPQLNVLVVGFPIKILVGLFVLALSAMQLGDVLIEPLSGIEDRLRDLAGALAQGR